LKTSQNKNVLTIEMVMEKPQENMERNVKEKGKSSTNLLAQKLVGKTTL
jgi:hypothetical protein